MKSQEVVKIKTEQIPKSRYLLSTSLKLRILENLKQPQTVNELIKSLKVPRDTIKPHLRYFLRLHLIERSGEGYRLTNIGDITLKKITELEDLVSLIENIGGFLATHDISFPEELIDSIHMLKNSYIVKKRNPYDLHEKWKEILISSEWICGVSPVYHPKLPEFYTELAEEKDVKLILTKDIFERCKIEHEDLFRRFVKSGEVYVCENATEAFNVIDRGFSLNLFSKGSYDPFNILICESEEGISWGLALFEHYLKNSKKILG